MLLSHSLLITHGYGPAPWAPRTLIEDEHKQHANNHVNIQCGEAALTLLQLLFSLRSLQECECKEKLYSGFLPLSILRSVPVVHHNDKRYSGGHTLVESHKGPAEKPQYLTEALNTRCSEASLVLADDWFLFSNVDMQHIQHSAYCSWLGKTPFHHTTKCSLSHEWFLKSYHKA